MQSESAISEPLAQARTQLGSGRIGQRLLQRQLITEADLSRALAYQAEHPGQRLGSILVRMGLVLVGFHLVGGGHWQRLVACLLGFLIARLVVMRLTRAGEGRSRFHAKEASHAP